MFCMYYVLPLFSSSIAYIDVYGQLEVTHDLRHIPTAMRCKYLNFAVDEETVKDTVGGGTRGVGDGEHRP